MLKRRLAAVEVDCDLELSSRHRKLEQHVTEALWRLQLLESDLTHADRSGAYLSRREGSSLVRKTWLARLSPSIQAWYNHSPGRRRLRPKLPKKSPTNSNNSDPLLVSRLLAEPMSLMVMSMVKSDLTSARQVADLHQLWETAQGKELVYSLAHSEAVRGLRRVISGRQLMADSSPADSIDSVVIQGLNHLAVPSAVERLLSHLLQTAPSHLDGDEEQTAVLLADLVSCPTFAASAEDLADVLTFALGRMAVDFSLQPWKTFHRLVRGLHES